MDLSEIKSLIEAQNRAWEEFKKTNDAQLAAKAEGKAIGDMEAKLQAIETDIQSKSTELRKLLDEVDKKATRAATFGVGSDGKALEAEVKQFNRSAAALAKEQGKAAPAPVDAEGYVAYKQAFAKFVRAGREELDDAERKALNAGTGPQGGYMIEPEMDSMIDRIVGSFGAMRSVSRVVQVGTSSYKKLVKTGGASAGGWGNETTAPTETSTPTWSEIEIPTGTLWAEPRATSEVLEDSAFNLEADLMDEVGIIFGETEGQAFIDGDGVNKPRGVLSYSIVANASSGWGSIGYTASGGSSGFAASNPSDALVSLQHSLKRQYRPGANWVMNDATLGAIRRFKDGQGIYLWAPSGLLEGASGQLLGHPVQTDDFVDDLGTNTYPVLFGDFRRGYVIVDRLGSVLLRDPYTAKPHIKFYVRRRVGAAVVMFEAIKCLKCATS